MKAQLNTYKREIYMYEGRDDVFLYVHACIPSEQNANAHCIICISQRGKLNGCKH